MAKIGKIVGGTAKVALAGTNFAVRLGLRAVSGPLLKVLSPELKPKNIIEECGYWFKDGIQDIKEGFSENA